MTLLSNYIWRPKVQVLSKVFFVMNVLYIQFWYDLFASVVIG